ncbi:hypothetical protein KC345_g78 [Hortaea werneckii]|nr:hypothetical protein KC345_g78 [Hortaea werneckii]
MRLKLSLVGIGVFNHSGNRVGCSLPPETKSAKDGPAFRRSLKLLAGRGWEAVADGGAPFAIRRWRR